MIDPSRREPRAIVGSTVFIVLLSFGCNKPRQTSADDPLLPPYQPVSACEDAATCQRGCDAKDYSACAQLVEMLRRPYGGIEKADYAKAQSLALLACQNGEARGCGSVALMANTGQGQVENESDALTFYNKGCELGDAMSCHQAGYLLAAKQDVSGADKAYRRAQALFRRGCFKHDIADDCHFLGQMLHAGKGSAPDVGGAVSAAKRACKLDKNNCSDVEAFSKQ
jgi:uncharacterized protein